MNMAFLILMVPSCMVMWMKDRGMDEIPAAVSIDEAVELCKTYTSTDDASFVNGVLGTVVRKEK
ncbi:MAG: hypothetical protein IIX60_05705 [Clostridia bacterium]|nr:hypothetical protein [Clostridia bacterium]